MPNSRSTDPSPLPTGQDTHWRVSFTTFAPRTLGELVEMAFEEEPRQAIAPGGRLDWINLSCGQTFS